MLLVEWLGAPALLAELRQEIRYLQSKVEELESERKSLQDSFLIKVGATPLQESEPLPPSVAIPTALESWVKQDLVAELDELAAMAERDPETYGPLLEDALTRYEPSQR